MKRVFATVLTVSFGFLTVVCITIASAQDSGRKVLRGLTARGWLQIR